MRGRALVLLCFLATGARAEQYFIPLDEQGNPIPAETQGSDLAVDTAGPVAEEAPAARLAREALEAEYRAEVEAHTASYTDCLTTEANRTLGPEFANCDAERTQLQSLYAAEYADKISSCLEIAVLGKSLSADGVCHLATAAVRDTSNRNRWQ